VKNEENVIRQLFFLTFHVRAEFDSARGLPGQPIAVGGELRPNSVEQEREISPAYFGFHRLLDFRYRKQ
jgi:hypothetical protein